MNTFPTMLSRLAGRTLDRLLRVHPVVIVMGARQTGKSTLVRNHPALANHRYLTLDDVEIQELATRAPADLLALGERLTIDEVQRVPDLLRAIKRVVDQDHPRRPGRFVLTGSANLLLMPGVSESLAGRAGHVTLWPLTRAEKAGLGRAGLWDELIGTEVAEWRDVIARSPMQAADWRVEGSRGGFPTPAHELQSDEDRALWFTGYVRTYLERDLQDLAQITSLVDFQRVMRAACLRLGNLVNQSEIARDVGVSQPTIHRWLNLLETSFQLVRIEPYSVNRTKSLIKTSKLYWSDTGLALHLSKAEPGGSHLENLVLTDLVAWRDARSDRPPILFWRTHGGEEVDFVVELPTGLLAIEVKTTQRPGTRDVAHLRSLRDEYADRFLGGLLLHDGERVESLGERIFAVPWWQVL